MSENTQERMVRTGGEVSSHFVSSEMGEMLKQSINGVYKLLGIVTAKWKLERVGIKAGMLDSPIEHLCKLLIRFLELKGAMEAGSVEQAANTNLLIRDAAVVVCSSRFQRHILQVKVARVPKEVFARVDKAVVYEEQVGVSDMLVNFVRPESLDHSDRSAAAELYRLEMDRICQSVVCPKCGRRINDFVGTDPPHCKCTYIDDPESWMKHCAANTPCRCQPRYQYYPVHTDDGGFRCPECKRTGTPTEWYEQNKKKEPEISSLLSRLASLQRYDINDAPSEEVPHPDGLWVGWSDIEALLQEYQDGE